MNTYTTGEIAKLCGISVRTVQFYDNKKVICPSETSEGGRRLYTDSDLKKFKVVCFLKSLNFSLNQITLLLNEKNSDKVITLFLENQENLIKEEIQEKQVTLAKLEYFRKSLGKIQNFSVDSISNVANIMKTKNKLKKLHLSLLLFALPVTIIEWASIILWIVTGIWWPFLVYTIIAIPFAIWISIYYYKRVAYTCPECNHTFKPKFKEMFWANHTPSTRKLTCPNCGKKSFCLETYQKDEK